MSWISWCRRPSSLLLLTLVAANAAVPIARLMSEPPVKPPRLEDGTAVRQVAPAQPREQERLVSLRAAVRPPPLEAKLLEPVFDCRAWGPLPGEDELDQLVARLNLAEGDFEVVEATQQAKPDYLVYIALDGSRAHLARVLRDLEQEKIDSQRLAGQGGRAALAVGVFSTRESADAHRERVAALGHQAHIRTLPRESRQYHLLARVPVGAAVEVPASGRCNEIAPLRQFL